MYLQQYNLNPGLLVTIVTENITHCTPIKVLLKIQDEKVLLSADATIALFNCYPAMRAHFSHMTFIGQVDYLVDKDYENNLFLCTTVLKYVDEKDAEIKTKFQMRFYDTLKKSLLIVPIEREALRFLYSRRTLIEQTLHFWDNKMSTIVREQDECVRAPYGSNVSLTLECKRTLLQHAPSDEFIPDKLYMCMPPILRHYLITWQDDGIGYLPIGEDLQPMLPDTDTDDDF
jgi:hypothetical protein